eukprot:1160563-Pelagomonas_calceolata.AAC.11
MACIFASTGVIGLHAGEVDMMYKHGGGLRDTLQFEGALSKKSSLVQRERTGGPPLQSVATCAIASTGGQEHHFAAQFQAKDIMKNGLSSR